MIRRSTTAGTIDYTRMGHFQGYVTYKFWEISANISETVQGLIGNRMWPVEWLHYQ